jgi:hypothetical protein
MQASTTIQPRRSDGGWIGFSGPHGGSGLFHARAAGAVGAGRGGSRHLGLVLRGFIGAGPGIGALAGEAEGSEAGEEGGGEEEFGGFHQDDGFWFEDRADCTVVFQSYTAGPETTREIFSAVTGGIFPYPVYISCHAYEQSS